MYFCARGWGEEACGAFRAETFRALLKDERWVPVCPDSPIIIDAFAEGFT
jgi:hypothetical protein